MLLFPDKDLAMREINMDFPVWYRSHAPKIDANPIAGTVSIGSMRMPLIPAQPQQFFVSAKPNAVSVQKPTALKIKGGSIRIGPITANEMFSSNGSAKSDLTVNITDITPFLPQVWAHVSSGSIQGTLDPVFLRKDRIETQGKIEIEAFNGKITLSQLGMERFSTGSPLVRLTAEFEGLDLGQLTTGTSFGRIEGVLRGYVKNLEISYGQPQRFDLLVETVKTKNVKQQISIQAIENISEIGGGQSPFQGLAGIFTSLFETLNYDKIGIRASLKNDVFQINGTIKEDGKEYLMKKGLLSGVNIVNQNPDNRISFKDMIKRVKRVAEGGKPVIR
jgi:hypothetical protein